MAKAALGMKEQGLQEENRTWLGTWLVNYQMKNYYLVAYVLFLGETHKSLKHFLNQIKYATWDITYDLL